ncbi:MAG: hypothetical protein IJE93_01650 [Clostridia bacterium]|nr:hypothetical protein [Clostridia bacterium]
MKEKKLYILTYDHGGYVLWGDRVKPRLKEIYKWMEKYPKLKIGLDYESFTFDEFSESDPEIVEMIKDLLERYPDRIGLGATTYGQPLSLTISEESNARQLIYAVKTNKHYFGQTPNVYAISEFALNNQTPQMIKLCGYDAAILRSHVMGYGYPRTFDSAWGNWIGKDKTAIPAVPTYDKQGRGFNCCTVDNWILSRWPENQLYSLEDFEEMFQKYSPVLASRYDDLTQEIEELTAYTQNKDNYEYVLLEDIPALYGKAEDELVTTDNDFHVQMPWGYCGNEIFNGVRKAEVEAVQTEKLNAFARMFGFAADEKKLEKAWKYALAAQHHDVTICGLLDLARRFVPESLNASSDAKKEAIRNISTLFGKSDSDSFLAINMHSFAVDEWMEIDGKQFCIKLPAFTAALLAEADNENYKYVWNEEKGELTTPCYKFILTDNGIASIYDVKNNRFIADNGENGLFTAYVDEKMCSSVGKWNVAVTENGAVATQTGYIGTVNYKFEMRFYGESARIDCKTQFELHGEKVGITGNKAGLEKSITVDGHLHEGKICLNLNLNLDSSRRMVRDLPYSISEWSGDIRVVEDYWYKSDRIIIDEKVSKEESFNNTTQINGIYWFALADSKYGFAVMNKGCMGGEIQGNRLSVPLLYSNIYLCGDKILEGTYDDEFALLPFESTMSDADLHRKAVSYAYKPAVVSLEKGDGKLKECTFIDFNSCGGEVILTSIYPENSNLLARFCNYSDDAAEVALKSSFGTVTEETDLLSRKIKDVTDGKLNFRPWEIKTVKIEL